MTNLTTSNVGDLLEFNHIYGFLQLSLLLRVSEASHSLRGSMQAD